jgi:hypothetical protein
MSIEKNVLVLGNNSSLMQLISEKLKVRPYIHVTTKAKIEPSSSENFLSSIIDIHQQQEKMDLIIAEIGADIALNKESLSLLDQKLHDADCRLLFIFSRTARKNIEWLGQYVHFVAIEEIASENTFWEYIRRLLRFVGAEDNNWVKIVDLPGPTNPKSYDKFTSEEKAILDKITTSPLRTPDTEFEKNTVKYCQDVSYDYDEKGDNFLLDEFRYIESVEDFHNIINTSYRWRMTHLLVGHRGCGKSCFINYYFRNYEGFDRNNKPYVIVDFFRYPYFIGNAEDVVRLVKRECFGYLIKVNHWLIQKGEYKEEFDLYPKKEMLNVIAILIKEGVNFKDVISDALVHKFDYDLSDADKTLLGRQIANDNALNENQAYGSYKKGKDSNPWVWFEYVYKYVDNKYSESPFNWFIDWVMKQCFAQDEKLNWANSRLFKNEELMGFYDSYVNKGATYLTNQQAIVQFFDDFINAVINKYGYFYIILDNLDKLSACLAEYRVMEEIQGRVAARYHKLQFIVPIRPSSLALAQRNYELDDGERFKKHRIKKVRLREVVKKRLANLKVEFTGSNNEKLLEKIEEVISLPVKLHKKDKNQRNVFDILAGLSGNNVRLGLELFANLFLSPHKSLFLYVGAGLLRKPEDGKYLAEHMAIRSIFLGEKDGFDFSEGLANLFYLKGHNNYAGILVQIRVLEILRKKRKTIVSEVYKYLFLLGYSDVIIRDALGSLRKPRLISILDGEMSGDLSPTSEDDIWIRYRGEYYYEKLLNRLSYIQMVYFLSYLPVVYINRFSFPNMPTYEELKSLIDNFLCVFENVLAIEQKKSTPENIQKYEQDICPLNEISQHIANIYTDYRRIEELTHGK